MNQLQQLYQNALKAMKQPQPVSQSSAMIPAQTALAVQQGPGAQFMAGLQTQPPPGQVINNALKQHIKGQQPNPFTNNPFYNAGLGLGVVGAIANPEEDGILRAGEAPIGQVFNDTQKVARERFNIPNLTTLSRGGSDRDVFDLGNKVLKVAKSARGLAQNSAGADWYAQEQGLIPNLLEQGKNYNVFEKVDPIDKNTSTMLSKMNKIGSPGNGPYNDLDKTQQLIDIMEKHGYPGSELLNYDPTNVMWGDILAKRNWGTKGGNPILLDDGTLGGVRMIKDYQGVKNLNDPDFRQVYNQSRAAKKQFGDIDKYTMYGAAALPLALQQYQNTQKQQ